MDQSLCTDRDKGAIDEKSLFVVSINRYPLAQL
jgi:hypothetical protein